MTNPVLAAVLFADVVGSTSLYEKLGDAEAHRRIETCLGRLGSFATRAGGRVVKTIGDEIMCAFADARAARRAACEMQQAQVGSRDGLGLRIGIHCGEAIERDGDLFGDTVNVAARITSIARRGQILASGQAFDKLSAIERDSARALGETAVRGRENPVATWDIVWDSDADLTLIGMPSPVALARDRLWLRCGEAVRELPRDGELLSLGRDPGCGLVVPSPRASRQHGRIEKRGNAFAFVDQSANGSWVGIDDDGDVRVHRGEMLLRGKGRIGLGSATDAPFAIEFELERAAAANTQDPARLAA